METVELIIKISITLFNAIALGFVLIMVSRWHRRMEDKLNEIREYTRRVSDRDDVIYMNQLQWLKSKLIEEERYEEAAKIIREYLQPVITQYFVSYKSEIWA